MRQRNNIYEGRKAWESLVRLGSSMKFGIERYRVHAVKMVAKAEKKMILKPALCHPVCTMS